MNLRSIRPHYLLKIDITAISFAGMGDKDSIPPSILRELEELPFVVARRGPMTQQLVPIGIRGPERFQRWAAWCPPDAIREVITPANLLTKLDGITNSQATPACLALCPLIFRWKWLRYSWGPTGSVGFELATGKQTTTAQSDLDIVIYADDPLSRNGAHRLLDATRDLEATIDIRVETPGCGFSLAEYANSPPNTILLRTVTGPTLGHNPWGCRL
jgi:phosphoribosyl-dephospho-CoA transferase